MGQDSTHNRSYFLNAGEEEKSIFLSTLCTLANADGKIKDSEVRFIESLAAEMQTEVLPQFSNTPQNCASAMPPKSAAAGWLLN